jgi:hypothetical protein
MATRMNEVRRGRRVLCDLKLPVYGWCGGAPAGGWINVGSVESCGVRSLTGRKVAVGRVVLW